ncbi:MAG: hypothetical protein Q4E53_06590 [Eubacteriales bacterium]|nr:hypothetical protein [Eubacteriales bacterium]
MNLKQINDLWTEYKNKYGIDSDRMIESVQYDTEEYVEGCFNLLELMDNQYILHLNPNIHLYNENYVKFILFHEFTHFYDFFHCPFEDKNEKLYFMNAYSEFHACKVTLARCINQYQLKLTDVDKIQIPGPYKEISIRTLLEESLYRVRYFMQIYYMSYEVNDFINAFRQLMYLFGYLSLFKNDDLLVEQTLRAISLTDERVPRLYKAMKDEELDEVVPLYKSIADDVILTYLRVSFRRYYDKEILPDEELEKITTENYRDYIRILNGRIRARNLVKGIVNEEDDIEAIAEEAAMISTILTQLSLLIL